jgi:hypothetical protein
VNATMYAMNFTRAATERNRCELCMAVTHTEKECAQRGSSEPDTRDCLQAIESAVLTMVKQPPTGPTPGPRAPGRPAEPSRIREVEWERRLLLLTLPIPSCVQHLWGRPPSHTVIPTSRAERDPSTNLQGNH